MVCQPVFSPTNRKKAKYPCEDSVLLLAYSDPAGRPKGMGVGSGMIIIKQQQIALD